MVEILVVLRDVFFSLLMSWAGFDDGHATPTDPSEDASVQQSVKRLTPFGR